MTTPRTRSRWVARLTVFAVVGALFAAPAVAAYPRTGHPPGPHELRDKLLGLVNRSRESRGLPRLRLNVRLSSEALGHSRKMAGQHRIFHTPDLAALITHAGGTVFGEDVGQGRGLRGIRDAWLRRPSTREILLDPRFHRVAIGVVHVGGFYWVTFQAYG